MALYCCPACCWWSAWQLLLINSYWLLLSCSAPLTSCTVCSALSLLLQCSSTSDASSVLLWCVALDACDGGAVEAAVDQYRLPYGYASAPIMVPSRSGGCPVAHPKVVLAQALAKQIDQLVALPDELRETTIRRSKRLCDKCGCHNERELAAFLAKERQPRACPLAGFLRICGQLAG